MAKLAVAKSAIPWRQEVWVLMWHDLTHENWVRSTGTAWIVLGNVQGVVSPTVDTLFVQGGIAEGVHYCPWEIESPFDKPGCFLHKSSCICLASKQELGCRFIDVSSVSGDTFFFLMFGRKWMAFIRRCWRSLLSVQKWHEFCSKINWLKEVVHFSSCHLKSLLVVGWDVDWPGYTQWLNKGEISVVLKRVKSIWQSTEQPFVNSREWSKVRLLFSQLTAVCTMAWSGPHICVPEMAVTFHMGWDQGCLFCLR